MNLHFLCYGTMFGMAAFAGGGYLLWRRHRMQQALIETCLLCESLQVAVRDRDGAYACRSCGFDTDLELFPGSRRRVEELRDLKHALTEFDAGARQMSWAQVGAVVDLAGGRSGAKYERMNEATKHMMEGFRLLKDVIKTRPDLLEMPIPGHDISSGLFLADFLMDNVVVNAIMISKIAASKREVEAFVARLRATYDALRHELLSGDLPRQAAAYVDALPKEQRTRALQRDAALFDADGVDPSLRHDPGLKNKRLPIFVGVLALAALLGVAGWLLLQSSERHLSRVLIAVRVPGSDGQGGRWWTGDEELAAAALADRLSDDLRRFGFEPIQAGDPEVLNALADADDEDAVLEAARELGASHVILGVLQPSEARPLGEGRAVEVTLQGELQIRSAHDDAHRPAALPVLRYGAGKDAEEAARDAAVEVGERELHRVIGALLTHPELVELDARESRTREEVLLAEQLRPARGLVQSAQGLLNARQQELDKLRERWEASGEQRPGVTNLSPLTHEEYLTAPLPGRQGALVKVDPRLPVVLARRPDKLLYESPRETITRVSLDGATREPLADAFNLFSYADASADGRVLAYVASNPHQAGHTLYTRRLDGDAAPQARFTADPEAQLSTPTLSPDGGRLVFFHRPCRRCAGHLEHLDLQTGERTTLVNAADAVASDPHWAGPHTLLWTQQAEEGPRQVLRRDLRADATPEVLLNTEIDPRWEDALPLPDEELVLVLREVPSKGPTISVLSLISREYRDIFSAPFLGHLAVSFDGAYAAVEIQGHEPDDVPNRRDVEIAAVRLSDGALTPLTQNAVRDRYPRWAPDRLDLYFETELDDPSIRSPIMLTRWVEVAP